MIGHSRTASTIFFTLLLLSTILAMVACQTFQYSRGWTNGKRAENSALDGIPRELIFSGGPPIQSSIGQLADVPTSCRLQKLKMLLQGNRNEQLYHLPCELLNGARMSLSEFPTIGHLRRSSTLNANNNY